jgi:hypothetical protein
MLEDVAGVVTLWWMGGIVAGAALGALAGWLWPRLAPAAWRHWSAGGVAGFGAALLCFGIATGELATVALKQQAWPAATGALVGFQSRTDRAGPGGRGRVRHVLPVVEVDLPDGSRREVLGLGGSLRLRAPGDPVPLRVDPATPGHAVIDDFQNRFAALGVSGAAMLGLLLMLLQSLADGWAARRPPPDGPWARWRDGEAGQAWRRTAQRAAWGGFALSLTGLFVAAEFVRLERAFAVCAGGMAAVAVCGYVSALLKPRSHPATVLFGGLAGVAAVVAAAAGLWVLSAP